MITTQHHGYRQLLLDQAINLLDLLLSLGPTSDIGLIGHYDKQIPGCVQYLAGLAYTGQETKFFDTVGRMRDSVRYGNLVNNSIPIQEHSGSHRIDSHFVWVCFRIGCETRRCQTTAWKASVWGVTFSELIVGTITQASATCAVKPPSRPTIPVIRAPT